MENRNIRKMFNFCLTLLMATVLCGMLAAIFVPCRTAVHTDAPVAVQTAD